jgi:hypothetical protein
MPMKTGPAQRGVGLVADDDRVGVRDLAHVADEPLVGLDRDRAVAGVRGAEQGGRDPVRVAAVAQLAVELVDEVAAVGEDQDAAGARGVDEAQRRNRLSGAGRMLEPEAIVRARVLGPVQHVGVDVGVAIRAPVQRFLGLVLLVLFLAGDADGGERAG